MVLKLKYCPRCKGDVFVDRDFYGWYEQCLQCGYKRDLRYSRVEKMLTKLKAAKEIGKNA